MIGDTHVYKNHITPLREQLKRVPKPFPLLKINEEVTDIDSFKLSDFKLLSYRHHAKIDMQLSV